MNEMLIENVMAREAGLFILTEYEKDDRMGANV